jgi:multidrug efflux pump subunit AcrA (membrane-fusion protein)
MPRAFEAGGTVRAKTTATIVSRIVAEVREIRVAPGDRVREGQPLIVLDSRELAANRLRAEATVGAAVETGRAAAAGLEAAEAGLALASATYRRIADLRQKNSATPSELDDATAGLRAAEAQVNTAKARVAEARGALAAARAAADATGVVASYAVLSAPFAGLVTEKLVEAGNLASPGVPLMRIEDTKGFRLEATLDESRAALIAAGDPVEVELGGAVEPAAPEPGGHLTIRGKVTEIARALDPGSHASLVKIDLPDHGAVRSGMFGRARFAGLPRRALSVPDASLMRRGQLVSVFVVDVDARARLRLVNVAAASGDLVEVLAGVSEGETVVVNPPAGLIDGTRVAPERSGAKGPPRATVPGGVQGAPPR